MLKCGWNKTDLPVGSFKDQQKAPTVGGDQSTLDAAMEERVDPGEEKGYDEEDDQDEESEDDDKEDDSKMQFADQHIRRWWGEARRLPPSMRPVFCLRHQFTDPFITFEERALPQILWSGKGKPNPASGAAAKIMTAKEASTLVESKHGELIRILFYGEPNEIKRSRSVWQTSYGRRSTTMDTLANNYPTTFAPTVLHSYLDNKFSFLSYAKDCQEKGVTCNRSPPPLPTSHIPHNTTQRPQRFALSNILATNGKELHVTSYDTTKPHRSRTAFVPIYRIENRFPTLESILEEFGVSSVEDIDVWGVDPGEANTAAFCEVLRACLDTYTAIGDNSGGQGLSHPPTSSNRVLTPAIEVKNLVVNRQALYQPVFAHRYKMEELKSTRVHVDQGQQIEGKLWAGHDNIQSDNSTSLPSISDIQNILPSHQHEQVKDLETSIVRFYQVQGLLHGFYGANRIKTMDWSLKKAKKAELDLAIDAILKACPKKTLFCYGNGSFRTGINLASPHEAFKAVFAQKVKRIFLCFYCICLLVSVQSETQKKRKR